MVLLGRGSLVSTFVNLGLIHECHLIMNPLIVGGRKTTVQIPDQETCLEADKDVQIGGSRTSLQQGPRCLNQETAGDVDVLGQKRQMRSCSLGSHSLQGERRKGLLFKSIRFYYVVVRFFSVSIRYAGPGEKGNEKIIRI